MLDKINQQIEHSPEGAETTSDGAQVNAITEDIDLADRRSSLDSLESICERIIQIIKPVTICCLYSCLLIRIAALNFGPDETIVDRTLDQIGLEATSFSINFMIVVVFCSVIVILTLFVLIIFYMGWHGCLAYFSYAPTLVTFVAITPLFLHQILQALNWSAFDMITIGIIMWNFTILGFVSIFGLFRLRAPLVCQQFYLIHNSSLLAVLIVQMLPGWAPWLMMIFMVIWDTFAVLAPIGPLNLILAMAEREGVVEMPGLVYSTASAPGAGQELTKKPLKSQAKEGPANEVVVEKGPRQDTSAPEARKCSPSVSGLVPDEELLARSPQPVDTINSDAEAEARDELPSGPRPSDVRQVPHDGEGGPSKDESGAGTNIGLGDFVFFSLLVGLTANGRDLDDFYSPLASLLAILVGLMITLAFLALTRRALPAVPVSVGLGVLVAYLTLHFVPRLSNRFAASGIFT